MGFNATWSMAVGGMVGGGIFSVLGVVVELADKWAWASFVVAGLIALATAHSYAALARRFSEGGGAFTFLRHMHRNGLAGSLSWVLIVGYVLTISVYAFTFGHYLGEVVGLGPWFPRAAGAAQAHEDRSWGWITRRSGTGLTEDRQQLVQVARIGITIAIDVAAWR